jgi:hypothetical protein
VIRQMAELAEVMSGFRLFFIFRVSGITETGQGVSYALCISVSQR